MNRFLIGLAAVPLLSGVALAAEPLSYRQMDAVTAGGGSATAIATAEADGAVIVTATATLAKVSALTDSSGSYPVVPVGPAAVNPSPFHNR